MARFSQSSRSRPSFSAARIPLPSSFLVVIFSPTLPTRILEFVSHFILFVPRTTKVKEIDGKPKYKARLVVKGYAQKEGIDFQEFFSPVVKMTTLRVLLALTTTLNLESYQIDVKTSFLHGDTDEEIYVKQLEDFVVPNKEHLVCKLKCSLYGLKQAPRQWYKKFHTFMLSQGFDHSYLDHFLYPKKDIDEVPSYLFYMWKICC